MIEALSRRAAALISLATALLILGAAPQAVHAAFITGPASGCLLLNTSTDCATQNLFNTSSTSSLSGPGFPDGTDFLGDSLDSTNAYQANFLNTLPGTSETHLDLLLLQALSPFAMLSSPVTWFFSLDVGPGSGTGLEIVDISEVAGGIGGLGIDVIDFDPSMPDSFAITTSFASLSQTRGVRLRIATRPIIAQVPVPGALLLAGGLLALLIAPARGRRHAT